MSSSNFIHALTVCFIAALLPSCSGSFDGNNSFSGSKGTTSSNPSTPEKDGSGTGSGGIGTGDEAGGTGNVGSGSDSINPALTPEQQKFCAQKVAIALVMDVSGSMSELPSAITDETVSHNVTPGSKIQLAISAAETFIGMFTKNPNDQMGLVDFSTNATTLSQLTTNIAGLKVYIDKMAPQSWTNIYQALSQADAILQPVISDTSYAKFVVLMSDGNHNQAGDPVAKATTIKGEGVTVYTVGFTKSAGAAALQKMATDADHFIDAADGPGLTAAFTTIATQMCR